MTGAKRRGMTRLPEWLLQAAPLPGARRRATPRFVQRTLRSAAQLLEQSLFSERCACQHGLLQRLDPRARLIGFLALLLAASLLHSPGRLWLLAGLGVGLALASHVPPGVLLRPVWWGAPALAALLAIPASLSAITPGELAFSVLGLHFSRQGLATALLLVSRVSASVSLAVALALTSRSADLLRALRWLGVPAAFVLVLGMTYRYLFLLLRTIEQAHLAKLSRTITAGPPRAERGWLGGRAAALFVRSRHLAEQVHRAMLARGFRGEAPSLESGRAGWLDVAWGLLVAGVCAGMILI
jgi:cobalt/nickel transport system permease protein